MTIRDTANWCPECEEACHQHPTHCTVCGTTLQVPPSVNTTTTNTDTTTSTTTGLSPIPGHLRDHTQATARELRELMDNIRQDTHMQRLREQLQQQANGNNNNNNDDWPPIPAILLDPSATPANASRPTSQAYLDQLPRITLGPQSSLLYQATLQIPQPSTKSTTTTKTTVSSSQSSYLSMEGILGELNYTAPLLVPLPSSSANTTNSTTLTTHDMKTTNPPSSSTPPPQQEWRLVVGDPLTDTGKGGQLSPSTVAALKQCQKEQQEQHDTNNTQSSSNFRTLLLLPRGHGVTFVQKALLAQHYKADVCLIANHVASPWPYLMQDSAQEGIRGKLTIPTVLLRQEDAQRIYNNNPHGPSGVATAANNHQTKSTTTSSSAVSPILHGCRFHLSQPVRDCVVCTDALAHKDVVLRLPPCGHVFHEACVLQVRMYHLRIVRNCQ